MGERSGNTGAWGSQRVVSAKKTSVVLVEPGAWLRELPRKGTGAAAVILHSENRQAAFFS